MSVKLSDIVKRYFKEQKLDFYLVPNTVDPRIMSIRKGEWPKTIIITRANNIGFVSDRRGKVALARPEAPSAWIDAADPDFFKKLHEYLLHV